MPAHPVPIGTTGLRAVGPYRYRFNPRETRRRGKRTRGNPVRDHFRGGSQFARFIVGFNVGGKPRWNLDDLETAWTRTLRAQRRPPDATFIAQRGLYTHGQGRGALVHEDGGSISTLNVYGEGPVQFQLRSVKAAEALAKKLKQESVILELGQGGSITDTMFVVP